MDEQEPTITLTRKQLLELGVPEISVNLLHFSNVQSNEPAQSASKLNQMNLSEPAFKKLKMEEEPEVMLNDLPELPFELILGYLSLQQRIKCRAVSRRWCKTIDSFRVKRLCYSQFQSGCIHGKSWVRGAFAQNFISSTIFGPFFQTFGQSILFNLKHLRLCDLRLTTSNGAFSFASTLNSFGRLEELDIVRVDYPPAVSYQKMELRLNLPMLVSIHLQQLSGINKLTLDSLNLQRMKLFCFDSLRVNLIHPESVASLIVDDLDNIEVKKLKNLRYLDIKCFREVDSTFLDSLAQLKEIQTDHYNVNTMFEQKQRYGRLDLKIYLNGLLLDGPTDPAIVSTFRQYQFFDHLVKNPSRVADQTAFYSDIEYLTIQRIPGLDANLLNKFPDLEMIAFDEAPQVQDIERFLAILKNSDNIVELEFSSDYSQALLDRLPDHCAIQGLAFCYLDSAGSGRLPDLSFVFRLRDLIYISIDWSIDFSFVQKAFEKLQFLWSFHFRYLGKYVTIEIFQPNHFKVSVNNKTANAYDLNAAFQFVVEKANEPEELEIEQGEE